MGEGLIAVIVVCVTALVVAAMVVYVKLVSMPRQEPIKRAPLPERGPMDSTYTYSRVVSQGPWTPPEEKSEEPVSDDELPHPVDPDHQPFVTNLKDSVMSDPPNCHCHGTPVTPGQRVLLWPVLGTHGKQFWIYCKLDKKT
jgi:hypothetical protein